MSTKKLKVKFVQLEPAAFILDCMDMPNDEFGVYARLNFMLYVEQGILPNNPEKLAHLCNLNRDDFGKIFERIRKKFVCKNSSIRHHKVTKELRAARKRLQDKINAGLASAEARNKDRTKPQQRSSNASTNISKGKVSKGKVSKGKVSKDKEKYKDFVLLTSEEYKKLIEKLGKNQTEDYIESLNDYLGSKGKKYRSHYHTILMWHKRDSKRGVAANKKIKLYPIKGKICNFKIGKYEKCGMPAVYEAEPDSYYPVRRCSEHLPEKVKERYE